MALVAFAGAVFRLALGYIKSGYSPDAFSGWYLEMPPNVAAAVCLLSASIWLAASRTLPRRRLSVLRFSSFVVALVALVTLSGFMLNSPPGIDDWIQLGFNNGQWNSAAARMSISSAFTLLFLSASCLLLPIRRFTLASIIAAFVPTALCYFNLVANLYGMDDLYGAFQIASMSVPTSLICVVVCGAVLALLGRRGPWRMLSSVSPGDAIARRLLLVAVLLPVAFVEIRLQGELYGFCGPRYGLAPFAVSLIAAYTAIVLFTARMVNVTESIRLTAQRQFIRSETEFSAMVESLPFLIWTCDSQGACSFLNKRWLDYTGGSLESQLGYGWTQFVHPLDLPFATALWRHSAATGNPIDVEYRIRSAAGDYRWFRAMATPILDHEGTITRWFGSSTDIETQKRLTLETETLAVTLEQRVASRTLELLETRAYLQSILDSAKDVSIIATDLNGVIRVFNAGSERMLGYPAAEVVGLMTVLEFHDPAELENARQMFSALQGRPVSLQEALMLATLSPDPAGRYWRFKRRDGAPITVHLSVTSIVASDGTPSGFLAIALDFSDRLKLERVIGEQNSSLTAAVAKAESATRSKSEFLANMSHEIRTPLNGVIGMTGLLLDTELSPEQRIFCETARLSGESLLSVINDILDFSKIEAGKMDIEEIDFDLRTTVDNILDLLAARAEEKGLELVCEVNPALPGVVCGDPGRLRQILLNLAGNAIKFTPAGTVSLRVLPLVEDPGRVRFEVSDTGVGIPPDRQHSLFRAFEQVDSSTTRRFGGTGLGLAICKELAELMDGTIGVSSQPGSGSTFWLDLKLSHRLASASPPPEPARASLADARVLVVDDSDANRLILCNLLLNWGCLFEQAEGALQALDLLRTAANAGTPFTVALIDHRMPELMGEDLGRLIKADPAIADTRLVLMTSVMLRGQARASHNAGFSAFLTKPIRQDDLRCAIEIVLGRRESSEPQTLVTQHSLAASRAQRGRILVVEDNRTNQLVAISILRKLGYSVDAVANGKEALTANCTVPYDLILMDCQMPVMDGYTATAEIRRGAAGPAKTAIPIIAMTAFGLAGDREKCLACGMNDYVAKPVDAKLLAATVARWLVRRAEHVGSVN